MSIRSRPLQKIRENKCPQTSVFSPYFPMPKPQSKDYPKDDPDQSQWVMLMPDECCDQQDSEHTGPVCCKLRHPKTDKCAMFLFSKDNHRVYEVLRFNEKYRSWFINETVQSDGSMFLPTPIDPLFLVLPYLIKSAKTGKFMQLEQIVEDSDFPDCNRLCSCEDLQHLDQICQVKGADDLKVYRYDKDLTLSWLKAKVERLSSVLAEKKVQTSLSSSCASTFIKSNKSTGSSPEDVERYAFGMLTDYLPQELGGQLQEHLGIKDIVHEKPEIEQPNPKRSKKDVGPTEDYTKHNGGSVDSSASKKNTRMTLAQKKLNEVDKKGIKNISSFFSPKAKK